MSQPPFSGPPYNGQPSSGQPYPGQQPPYQGQQPPYQGQQPPYQQPYGQPNPDVPSSVPPSYPPTQSYPTSGSPDQGQGQYGGTQYGSPPPSPYGQPDYAQQGFGQPGFPPAQPPKKKSKTLPIILTAVGIVLVLCVGGTIAAVMAANNSKDKVDQVIADATRTPTAGPTTDTATAEPTPEAENIEIVEPKTLGGRPKLTDPQFASVATELENELKSVPGSTSSVGALYGTVAKQDIVIVAAAAAPIANPERELDQAFYGAGVGGLKISNISAAPTGALGGSAKCGSAKTGDIDMAICSWADDGSLGMLIWYFKSVAKAKAELPRLRAQIEKKS